MSGISRKELKNFADNPLNCPNCGSPLGLEPVCKYCGTHFIDCTIDSTKPFYIKIRRNGQIYIDKVVIERATVTDEPETSVLYADDKEYLTMMRPRRTYALNLLSLGVTLND